MDQGPIHLINAGLVDQLKSLGWNVEFNGHHQFEDISVASDPPIGILKNPRLVSKVSEAVAKTVGGHAKAHKLPLTLGGDHSLVSIEQLHLCGVTETLQAMGTISGTLEYVYVYLPIIIQTLILP